MRRYSAYQMIETTARVAIGTDNMTRFKNKNTVATGYVNRAVKIDILEQVIETDLNQAACINGDCCVSFRRDYSYVRDADAFIAWGRGRILPFFRALTWRCA